MSERHGRARSQILRDQRLPAAKPGVTQFRSASAIPPLSRQPHDAEGEAGWAWESTPYDDRA